MILKKLSQLWRNLLNILEEIVNCEEFLKYCSDISIKFWISFDENKWDFEKIIQKYFITIRCSKE